MRIKRPGTVGESIRDAHRLADEMFGDGRPSPWHRQELEEEKPRPPMKDELRGMWKSIRGPTLLLALVWFGPALGVLLWAWLTGRL